MWEKETKKEFNNLRKKQRNKKNTKNGMIKK